MCQALAVPGYIIEWLHWPKWSKNSSVSRITSRKKPRSSAWVTSCLTTTPSSSCARLASVIAVGPVRAHVVLHRVVGLDRLAGVAPEPAEDVVLHQALLDVPVVHVRDLQLATRGWLEVRYDVPHGAVIEVDAGDREIAGRILRLLDDALDARVAVHRGDAQMAKVAAVGLAPQHDPRAPGLAGECLGHVPDRAAEDVVAEQHHRAVAADEML